MSEVQKNVLARGLNFGIPPKLVEQEVKAEFELCWSQLRDLPAASAERRDECKATSKLSGLEHKYANSKEDRSGFPLDKEHFTALKELKRNEKIAITKPDKGNGVVILDKADYVAKMMDILSQEEKFQRLGDVEKNDNTLQQERALQAFLLRQLKTKKLPKDI